MARPIQLMLALAATLLLAGGCGGADDDATAEPPTATTAMVADAALTIDDPGTEPLRARRDGQRLIARAPLSGSARPFSVLQVTSVCAEAACTRSATADEHGRWRTSVRVTAPRSTPYARVTAQLAGESAVALFELRAPGAKKGAKQAKRPKRRRAKRATPAPAGGVTGGGTSAPALSSGTGGSTAGGPGAIPAPTSSGAPRFVMIGDSLAEGTASRLPGLLPGWSVITDGETGRTLSEGMAIWRASRGSSTPTVAAFSLFTNDSPSAVASFEAAVRETVTAPAAPCVIWATIARPAVGGTSYAAANAALERVAAAYPDRLFVVPWARAVREHPEWLRPDGVHATAEGYAARAQMYADAARGCSGR